MRDHGLHGLKSLDDSKFEVADLWDALQTIGYGPYRKFMVDAKESQEYWYGESSDTVGKAVQKHLKQGPGR